MSAVGRCRGLAERRLTRPRWGKPQNQGLINQAKRPIPYCACVGRVSVAVFEIGTIISYRGRLHVVVGITPMSVTPPLLELEYAESGHIRRVRGDDPQLVVEPTKRLPADDE
jgi:hypothetical protein